VSEDLRRGQEHVAGLGVGDPVGGHLAAKPGAEGVLVGVEWHQAQLRERVRHGRECSHELLGVVVVRAGMPLVGDDLRVRVRRTEHHRVGQRAGVVRAHDPDGPGGEDAVEERLVDRPLVPLGGRGSELHLSDHAHAQGTGAQQVAQRLVVARDHLGRPRVPLVAIQERHALALGPERAAEQGDVLARGHGDRRVARVQPVGDERDHALAKGVVGLVQERVMAES
jgi:hypothetical protein